MTSVAPQSVNATAPVLSYAERARKGKSVQPSTVQRSDPPHSNAESSSIPVVKVRNDAIWPSVVSADLDSELPSGVRAPSKVPAVSAWATRPQPQSGSRAPSESASLNNRSTKVANNTTSVSTASLQNGNLETESSLVDTTAWPDVTESMALTSHKNEKHSGEPSAASSPQKKDKRKWLPATDIQAAFDANRTHIGPRKNNSKSASHSQTRSQSSTSNSMVHSLRSSPRSHDRRNLSEENGPTTSNSDVSHPAPADHKLRSHPVDLYSSSTPHVESNTPYNHRRPSPSKSQPVDGWTFEQGTASPIFKPLFGSFQDRLSVNESPHPAQLHSLGDGSLPPLGSPVLRGEHVTKQRGKIAIGLDGNNVSQNLPSPGQTQFEFGQFDQPTSSGVDSRRASRSSVTAGSSTYRGGSRRESFGEHSTNGMNGNGSYRTSSVYNGGSSGGRRGRGGGRHYGHRHSGSFSRVSSSYRGPPPHATRGYSQFEGIDSYVQGADPYFGYYGPVGSYAGPQPYPSPFIGPYVPIPPTGMPMYLPPVPVGVSPTTLPPIPTPVTKPGFPLDPPRFYLLGQIEYYFSVQNLATDLFLRRQMDGEGWIEIGMIASFNRMQRLTLDVSLVRDTMMISSMLEVKDNKVRLANDQWKAFILPHSEQNALSNTSRSSAAYSLANTLSGLQISGDDAATIQAKVTVAVLGTKSSIFQITEADGNGKVPEGEKDESSSNTTTGSVLTDATPAATTSPPTSDEEIEKRLPA